MLLPIAAATALTLLIGLILAFTARLIAILPKNRPRPQRRRGLSISNHNRVPSDGTRRSRRLDRASRDFGSFDSPDYPYGHIMIVLGSGGHTAEMLLMLQQVKLAAWKKRTWVVSSGDGFSAGLANETEQKLGGRGGFDVIELPRARKVHQSILTAPFTSLICLWSALQTLRKDTPDIILTNGPATGVILILASLVLRFFAIDNSWRTRCIYIESLARCKKLSLSGRLLKPVVDRFLVQWPELESERAEFRGEFALEAAIAVGMEGLEDESEIDMRQWITFDL